MRSFTNFLQGLHYVGELPGGWKVYSSLPIVEHSADRIDFEGGAYATSRPSVATGTIRGKVFMVKRGRRGSYRLWASS